MKTYKIGRSTKKSDIVLPNMTTQVSGVHIELVDMGNGRYYLTDLSTNGTFILVENNQWKKIKQTYVYNGTHLMLANFKTTVYEIIQAMNQKLEISESLDNFDSKPKGIYSGKMERNPETGEIIRR
ncbi:MAG: FHA domain-containing protein [Thiomargarita sp.]|nr:FHA domain-containing protein [Thiomargarita sp.]